MSRKPLERLGAPSSRTGRSFLLAAGWLGWWPKRGLNVLSILMFVAVLAAAEPPPLRIPPAPVSSAPQAPVPPVLAGPRPSIIRMPDWAGRPSGADVARLYPERAQRLEMEGRVVLLCNVEANGFLSGCRAIEETPPDFGFGEAALQMSALFRLKPMTRDGQPVAGGTVRIPLNFRGPDSKLTAGLTTDEALACHGYWSAKVNFLTIGGPAYMSFLFANEVKWQARLAGVSEQQIEGSLAAARKATSKRAPMPPKCGLSEGG